MRKRVFGSIFLTSLVTLLLTTGLLLLAVHAGLTNDMRQRLVTESSYLSAVDNIGEELEKFGSVYADRLTLVAQDGTVLYDNRTNASEMENHAVRPEIAAAEKNGTGEDNRLSETFAKQTFYYAVRLKNGDVLRISATADSVFGALSNASPWIVLIILLALLVAALLAGWLTGLFLKPIEALDLHDPMKGEAYDELSPLLHRMDKQTRKIQAQMDELQRRQAEFDDITARMDEGLVLFSGKGMILFANHAARALFPHDSAEGSYLTLCRDANYIQVVERALDGNGAHGKLERNGRIYELTASSVEENSAWHAAVLLIVDITERERAEQQRQEFTANVSHELKTPLTSILNYSDLLGKMDLTPEEANDYARIIYQKGLRLKNLTSDLFDISKVQSGAEQIISERLDACTLARQALAEQDKAVQESGLTVKAAIPERELPIWADGRKLSRVLENLIGNCVKYALKGTRVFLSVAEENGRAIIELKNTANYEMDFDADEITERFVRGDAARSTEGSGLGLAIAKSYTEVCGGTFDVSVDGDQFKVRIGFPVYGMTAK